MFDGCKIFKVLFTVCVCEKKVVLVTAITRKKVKFIKNVGRLDLKLDSCECAIEASTRLCSLLGIQQGSGKILCLQYFPRLIFKHSQSALAAAALTYDKTPHM